MRLLAVFLLLSFQAFAQELVEVRNFGPNPGALTMLSYTPDRPTTSSRLLVVLHGCLQSGGDIVRGSGLLALAARQRMHLLIPQQNSSNNGARCFNWFQQEDILRERGEAASIKAMIDYTLAQTGIAADRVAIMGFSAGAGFTASLLAAYPEVFSKAIIVAGIPHGCATGPMNSFSCMSGSASTQTPRMRGDHVRRSAGTFIGPWPEVMIIHGTRDEIVNFRNAQFLVDQWTDVHSISNSPIQSRDLGDYRERIFGDDTSTVKVREVTIPNMRHGFPIDAASGCGRAQSYILETKVCGVQLVWDFLQN